MLMFVSLGSVKLWFWVFSAIWEQFKIFPLVSYYFAIPFAAGAMLVRFVQNSEMALCFAAIFSVLSGFVMDSSMAYTFYCLVSSLVAAGAVSKVGQRASLMRAGAVTGLVNMFLAISMSLFAGDFFSFQTVYSVIFGFAGGILASTIVMGVAPLVETAFGYTTEIKLLELANLNHPLLKELIVQAPGSYHHSIIVGSLVEAAAESIRSNPLLARVMAYYHDIGKIRKPAYFSENQRDGVNRHDKLKPSLSASVLRAHVKDGVELACEYRLGQPIVEAIQQHHGTSLMKFFYQKARDLSEPNDTVNEEDFRYAGPRPQMREVALVLLADSVEAAAKSISDPSPARLQGLVQNIVNRIFVDGQLDECDLTLKDLHEIARAFNRVLTGIYHYRPDYPEVATREREQLAVLQPVKESDSKKRQETPDDKHEDFKRLGI
jgi:putative nucleotidyltransferase with HDIG domain